MKEQSFLDDYNKLNEKGQALAREAIKTYQAIKTMSESLKLQKNALTVKMPRFLKW